MRQSKSDPLEIDHLLKELTYEGQHHRKMSLTDSLQLNDITKHSLYLLIWRKLPNNITPGCPILLD